MNTNWGSVVSSVEHEAVKAERDQHAKAERFFFRAWVMSFMAFCFTAALAYGFADGLNRCSQESTQYRATARGFAAKSSIVASALSHLRERHQAVVNATTQVEAFGKSSWGRRFTVTKYVPSAGGINADSDREHTATMWKAKPRNRIVAVDPEVIPYGSWVWIEGLGWFNAQDCGGAIKGFRLDVLSGNLREAFNYGKQDRFVIVVPKDVA